MLEKLFIELLNVIINKLFGKDNPIIYDTHLTITIGKNIFITIKFSVDNYNDKSLNLFLIKDKIINIFKKFYNDINSLNFNLNNEKNNYVMNFIINFKTNSSYIKFINDILNTYFSKNLFMDFTYTMFREIVISKDNVSIIIKNYIPQLLMEVIYDNFIILELSNDFSEDEIKIVNNNTNFSMKSYNDKFISIIFSKLKSVIEKLFINKLKKDFVETINMELEKVKYTILI